MRSVHLFLETNLGCSHLGLGLIASKARVKFDELGPGDAVLFFNRKKTAIKAMGCNGVIFHVKAPEGITIHTLDAITDAVVPGERMKYSAGFRAQLCEALGIRMPTVRRAA